MRTSDLDYELPDRLIACEAVEPRDAARMLVVLGAGLPSDGPGDIEHARVSDLGRYLRRDDLLVFNRSRVLPARFVGVREDTGGSVEGLYLHDFSEQDHPGHEGAGDGGLVWVCMVKSRRFRVNAPIRLLDPGGEASGFRLRLIERVGAEGAWLVRVEGVGGSLATTPEILARVGRAPLPPYILAARRREGEGVEREDDLRRYQTVYAREEGSVAAPTAGLHFTPRLLEDLARKGIERGEVVLHVGAGTFRGIETERVEDHAMHAEWCSMDGALRARIRARATGVTGGRVIGVGTTSVRTIETFARLDDADGRESLETDLMVHPGRRARWTHGLMTNFHLPRTTLMALVASFLEVPGEEGSGVRRLLAIYREAIAREYRFFSFGDAMLVA